MDQTDKKLLNILQTDGRLDTDKLSKVLFISKDEINEKLQQFKQDGIITSFSARVDLDKVDLRIKAFVQIDINPNQKDAFYAYIRPIPNVLECNCITGPYSMLLKVAFEESDQLDDFINKLHKFGRTNTQMVFSTPITPRGFMFEI